MKQTLFGMALAGILAAAAPASAKTYNLTLAGASPGGLWSSVGAGFDKAIAQAYPGSTITYQTGSGGLANAKLVADNKVPIGLAQDSELNVAWKGEAPFKKPFKDLRVLFRAYSPDSRFQVVHLLMNKEVADEHGIKTFADIVSKKPHIRIAVNRPGNMDGALGLAVMKAMGASEKAIRKWGGTIVRAATREQTSLMLDRRIDMSVAGYAYNHPAVREMANGLPLLLMGMTDDAAQKVAKDFNGRTCHIKKGEYEFLHEDITTVCVGAVVIVNKSMDDQTAYDLVKGLLSKLDSFKSAHRLLQKATTPQSLAEPSVAPFHPGALRAFKEAGLIK